MSWYRRSVLLELRFREVGTAVAYGCCAVGEAVHWAPLFPVRGGSMADFKAIMAWPLPALRGWW